MKRPLLYFLLVLVLQLIGCKNTGQTKLAEVDGQEIYLPDFEKAAGKDFFRQREALFRLQQQKLEEYISALLLSREAKSRGVSVSTLLEQEINGRASPVTEGEIESFYNSQKDRLRVESLKVHDQIRDYLRDQKIEKQKNDFIKLLRAKAKISTYLKPPPVYRAEVVFAGAPMRGAEKALVTIVKFEDFQCPYCKTVQPTFLDVLKRYDGKIRLVHKDLPLDAIHPQARSAAEAARCAADQGKFWEYHDKLYAQSPKLAVEELKSAAKEIGLNVASFYQCLVSGKFKAAVQRDFNEAAGLGLTGTPAFFINGRELIGAQPIEAFTAIIDEELALAK